MYNSQPPNAETPSKAIMSRPRRRPVETATKTAAATTTTAATEEAAAGDTICRSKGR